MVVVPFLTPLRGQILSMFLIFVNGPETSPYTAWTPSPPLSYQ
jgi:hypothetical protein